MLYKLIQLGLYFGLLSLALIKSINNPARAQSVSGKNYPSQVNSVLPRNTSMLITVLHPISIDPLQLRERLASLSQRFTMAKPFKERKPPKNEIEELNEWLADPVLRNTAMSKIMQSDDLTVDFDEEGIPIQVIKQSS